MWSRGSWKRPTTEQCRSSTRSGNASRLEGILSIEDIVVRGLEGDGIDTKEIVSALRTMYVRVPVAVDSGIPDNGFTPG